MSGMLNTLLDINQLEAGIVLPALTDFPIDDSAGQLATEFAYHAQAGGLAWHVVPRPHRSKRSQLLEQIMRNLLSNAVKYTQRGRGPARLPAARRCCASKSGTPGSAFRKAIRSDLRGVPSARQPGARAQPRPRARPLDRAAAGRSARPYDRCPLAAGQGLGLHRRGADRAPACRRRRARRAQIAGAATSSGTVLIVEDDPALREMLELVFKVEGYAPPSPRTGGRRWRWSRAGDPARNRRRRLQSAGRPHRHRGRARPARGARAARSR